MSTVNAYRVTSDGKAQAITVGDLKALIAKVPDSATVRLWSDAEGNQERDLLEVHLGSTRVTLVPFD